MRVVLADSASADLDDIEDWIGADDWNRADSFRDTLRDKCATLASNPRRYPIVARVGADTLRKLGYRDYLIFYRMLENRVEVVRIVHGKRDWVALLQGWEPRR